MRILRILLILSISCSSLALKLTPEDEAARDAALQWLRVVDSGNYQDAALMISEQVRGSRDWANYFATHRAAFGRMKNRQIAEVRHASSVPDDPEVRQHAIIQFKTSFEHQAGAAEEIVMTKMGCCWEVSNYRVE